MNNVRPCGAQRIRPLSHIIALFIIVSLLALFTSACRVGDLAAFSLQENTGWPIEGRIIDSIDAVDVYAKNALTIAGGGAIAFRTRQLTDGVLSMQLTLQSGNSVTLFSRTTPHSDTVLNDAGIALTIGIGQVSVAPLTPAAGSVVDVQPNVPFIVEIFNDGPWIDITVACKHIGRFSTERPSTEWMILRSNGLASCTLVDPRFQPLYADYEPDVMP